MAENDTDTAVDDGSTGQLTPVPTDAEIRALVDDVRAGRMSADEALATVQTWRALPAVSEDSDLNGLLIRIEAELGGTEEPGESYESLYEPVPDPLRLPEFTPSQVGAIETIRDWRAIYRAMRDGGDVQRLQVANMSTQQKVRQLRHDLVLHSGGGRLSEERENEVLGFVETDFRLGDVEEQESSLRRLPEEVHDDAIAMAIAGGRIGWILEDLTPSEMQTVIVGMTPDQLAAVQVKFDAAGLYGESRPVFGVLTPGDFRAMDTLAELFKFDDDRRTVTELLDDLTAANNAGLGQRSGVLDSDVETFELTNTESLRTAIEDAFLADTGRLPKSEEIVKRAIDKVHAQEKDYYRRSSGDALSMGGRDDIDRFMAALSGQESGGNPRALGPVTNSGERAEGQFQIMPSNWPAWSREVFGFVAPKTPENQRIVARAKIQDYFNRYGNWRDVAIAWYAGRGAVNYSQAALNAPQTVRDPSVKPPTINQYADQVMSRYHLQLEADFGEVDSSRYSFIEGPFDDTARRRLINEEVRAADEAQYLTFQFSDRMADFFSLLGGA